MIKSKTLRVIIPFLMLISILSCNSDDNNLNIVDELIGEWRRSDFSDDFEYKLIFNADNTGTRTEREGNVNGTGISNAVTFSWSANKNLVMLNIFDQTFVSNFSINPNGQLILSDLSNLHFDKLE